MSDRVEYVRCAGRGSCVEGHTKRAKRAGAASKRVNAAAAGATVVQTAPASSAASIEQSLQSLEGPRMKGLISDAEYVARRQQLIAEV